MDTCLTDLPDELLLRCLAGAGGMGVGAAAASCSRLHTVARRLQQLPVFSSAASTNISLKSAITDAAQRALAGCFGVVDFALLFIANYGTMKNKKYSDPTDVGHAVEMLREVLGQDVVIVGCAAAGVMGVGPDSQPIEVDPLSNSSRARSITAARRKAGLPPPPSKGVSVLLGKLPVGCVARGLVLGEETFQGPIPPAKQPNAPASAWTWPALDEALTLTSSQKAAITKQLAQAGTARSHSAAHRAARSSDAATALDATSPGPQSAAAQAAEAELDASPETAAAAQGLLSVVASASAAAAADAAAAAAADPESDVELVPQTCLLLFDSSLQDFEGVINDNMQRALKYLAARDVMVAGGASSGSGDLFFSPGAEARRVMSDAPPCTPMMVGLLLCTARASAAAVAQQQPAAAAAAAAAATGRQAAAAPAGPSDDSQSAQHSQQQACSRDAAGYDSRAALRSAALATMGLGPAQAADSTSTAVFTDLSLTILDAPEPSEVLATQMVSVSISGCSIVSPAAQQQLPGGDEYAQAASGAAVAPEAGSRREDTKGGVRRSARRSAATASAAPAAATAGPVGGGLTDTAAVSDATLPPLEQLWKLIHEELYYDGSEFMWDDEEDDAAYLALWLCPSGSQGPPVFPGDEEFVLLEVTDADYVEPEGAAADSTSSSSSRGVLSLNGGLPPHSLATLKKLVQDPPPGSRLCCQLAAFIGPSCTHSVRCSLERLLPMVSPVLPAHTAATAAAATSAGADVSTAVGAAAGAAAGTAGGSGAAAAGGAGHGVMDCYDALARCAAASGARSGLSALAVFNCNARGQEQYMKEGDLTSFGQVSDAAVVDRVAAGSVPFVGAFVAGELGPEIKAGSVGWAQQGVAAQVHGYTCKVAAWGCQPGCA